MQGATYCLRYGTRQLFAKILYAFLSFHYLDDLGSDDFQTFQDIDYAILGAINFMDTMPDTDASSKMFRDSLRQMTTMTLQLCASEPAVDESIEKTISLQTPDTSLSSFKDYTSRRREHAIFHPFPGIASQTTETRSIGSRRRCWTPASQKTATLQDRPEESGSFPFENPIGEHLIHPFRDYDSHYMGRGTRNQSLPDTWEASGSRTDRYSTRGSPEIPTFNFEGREDYTDSSPETFVFDTGNDQTDSPPNEGQDLLEAYLVGWGENCPPIVS